jgi:outer membrane protein, heavy metal efflux system
LATVRTILFGILLLAISIPQAIAQTGGEWTIEQCVNTALSKHHGLQAAGVHLAGMEGLKMQAALRPNPEIIVQTENWRFTGSPSFQPGTDLDLYAYVSQPLETGGKRARRMEAATQETKVAEIERRVLGWRIRQDVRQAFIRALLAQKQLDLLGENARYFEQIVEYHRVRFEQGATAEADLIKVRLEQERFALAQNAAQVEAEKARVDLQRAMGVVGIQPNFRLADLPPVLSGSGKAGFAELIARARSRRPEIQLGGALVERARAQVASQKAMAKPDWNIMFGYKRTSGYDTVLASFAVPLPIFNRNTGNIYYTESEVERTRLTLGAIEAQMEAEVSSALAGIRRRHSMLQEMQRGLVDRAEESWRISLAAYREGGTDLLRLLDAQRVRSEIQSLFSRTQMEYRLSLAELESAVGEENLSLAEELLRVQ